MKRRSEIVAAAMAIRDLWLKQPVANTPEWHEAVLWLVQSVDRYKREGRA